MISPFHSFPHFISGSVFEFLWLTLYIFGTADATLIIRYSHVLSVVQMRIANTEVVSRVENPMNQTEKMHFTLTLPKNAFITSFSMEENGAIYLGEIREKHEAEEQFRDATVTTQSASLLRKRSKNEFEMVLSVSAFSKLTVNLTYQEVIESHDFVFKHVLRPFLAQELEYFTFDAVITSRSPIRRVHVPRLTALIHSNSSLYSLMNQRAHPSADISNANIDGLGIVHIHQNSVRWPEAVILIEIQPTFTNLLVSEGYFLLDVGLPRVVRDIPTLKNVVFCIDKSGSMRGGKLSQVKEAMRRIFSEMSENDYFSVMAFDKWIRRWQPKLVAFNDASRKSAIEFISGLEANGGTNLWIAIKECYDMLRQHEESHPNSFASMVFLMTDGRPTVGAQDPSYFSYKIRSLKGDHVIHAVAFGSGSDFAFIQHITNSRHGISRRIYEDADAYIQIAGFYHDVASPVMKNIHVNYISGSVDLNSVITNAVTSTAYNGSSFYLLGRLDSEKLSVSLTGEVFRGPFRDTVNSNDFCPPNCERSITLKRSGEAIITNRRSIGYFLERMWVHKTIEKFENLLNEDPKNADELRNRIRSLSLRHSLLTSETAICIEINGENMEIEQSNEINEDYSKVRPPEIQSVKFYKNAGFSFPRYVLSFLFIQLLILIYLYVSKVHRGSSDTGDNDLFLRTNNA